MQNLAQVHAQDYHQNVTEPQATEYHTKRYTRVQHRNCESGLAKAWCTQAGPAHAAGQHGQMKPSFLACATRSPHHCSQKRSESSDRNRESCNKDKWHSQIAMQLPLSLWYWIGKSTRSLRPCYCHRGGRLFTVNCYRYYILKPSFEFTHDAKHTK